MYIREFNISKREAIEKTLEAIPAFINYEKSSRELAIEAATLFIKTLVDTLDEKWTEEEEGAFGELHVSSWHKYTYLQEEYSLLHDSEYRKTEEGKKLIAHYESNEDTGDNF